MIAAQDFEMMTGNSYELIFTVVDDEGDAFTPSVGDVLTWRMRKNDAKGVVALTKTDTSITFAVPGEILVAVDPVDTTALTSGSYYHELVISRSATQKETIAYGTVTMLKSGVL